MKVTYDGITYYINADCYFDICQVKYVASTSSVFALQLLCQSEFVINQHDDIIKNRVYFTNIELADNIFGIK